MDRIRSVIAGTGSHLPENVVTNFDLEKIVDTSNEWILERTGIKERRIAKEGESLVDFSEVASLQALEAAGMEPMDLDFILCGTVTPDYHIPASACFLQDRLGAKKAVAFDLSAGCSGFLFALSIADQYIRSGTASNALIIGAELLSKYINWKDRTTCVIFADGAGAVVLKAERGERGILATRLHSDGEKIDFITIPGGGTMHPPSVDMLEKGYQYIHMRGNETFKLAVRSLTKVSKEVMKEVGVKPEDIALFIPHQANVRIMNAVGRSLDLEPEKVFVNIDKVGNTSAASIPIAVDEAYRTGRIKEGDILLFSAFGSGLTWAASLVRW